MNDHYHQGLLHLTHLLIGADGNVDKTEINALKKIRQVEKIPDDIFKAFQELVKGKTEKEIYKTGMALVNKCNKEEKLRTFATLYRLSEVDGNVHVKEIKLLMYAIELAGIEFDDVVQAADRASIL